MILFYSSFVHKSKFENNKFSTMCIYSGLFQGKIIHPVNIFGTQEHAVSEITA